MYLRCSGSLVNPVTKKKEGKWKSILNVVNGSGKPVFIQRRTNYKVVDFMSIKALYFWQYFLLKSIEDGKSRVPNLTHLYVYLRWKIFCYAKRFSRSLLSLFVVSQIQVSDLGCQTKCQLVFFSELKIMTQLQINRKILKMLQCNKNSKET